MLGKALASLRKRLPHYAKASHFAETVGCTREHYRRIEAGTGHPSYELMGRIITALEISPKQAHGLWAAWGLCHLPPEVTGNLIVIYRPDAGAVTATNVIREIASMVDIGEGDVIELSNIIFESIEKEGYKWPGTSS